MAEKVYNWTDDPMVSGVADCNTDVVNDCLMHLKYENTTDAIQNMYTTGQVETQTRGFNQLQQMRRSTFDLSKFTVVGSPTITEDGVASEFSSGNYIQIKNQKLGSTTKISIKAKRQTLGTANETFFRIVDGSGVIWRFYFNKTNTMDYLCGSVYGILGCNINTTEDFIFNVEITPAQFKFSCFIGEKEILINNPIRSRDYINIFSSSNEYLMDLGSYTNETGLLGSIDLSHFSITVDGKEVFSGNKTGLDVIKPDNYDVVGSPVISEDGIASGFSASDYITTNSVIITNKNNFTLEIPITIPTSLNRDNVFIKELNNNNAFSLKCDKRNKLNVYSSGTTQSGWFTVGTLQSGYNLIKVVKTNSTFNLYSNNNLLGSFENSNLLDIKDLYIGSRSDSFYLEGSIDLNAFKIYVDGNLVYQPCLKIPYTQSKTGSKIVDEVYRDRVIDLYEQEGQAGYYTIDEPNKNFTLPMGEIYGMIEQKGTYQPPLLSTMWSDHLLNDMSWLRADTFSWQDGTTYSQAYNELLNEYNNPASVSETEGSITFKRTPKGYKIALATQETAIAEKYATDGIAWYYILDTTNKKFKLPLMKYKYWKNFSSETLPVIGNGNMLGLYNPNATGSNLGFGITATQYFAYGVTKQNEGNIRAGATINDTNTNRYVGGVYGVSTDASKSGLIADSSSIASSIEETEFYLYFYVGAFTKSAEAQTAGLNSELLNGKLDLNANNLDTEGKSLISGLCMPSDKYIDLTLGESGTTYTAPANGWFAIKKNTTNTNGYLYVQDTTVGILREEFRFQPLKDASLAITFPVLKRQKILVGFSNADTTEYFHFIYAEGSKGE